MRPQLQTFLLVDSLWCLLVTSNLLLRAALVVIVREVIVLGEIYPRIDVFI